MPRARRTLTALALAAALPGCGFRMGEDPELEEAMEFARWFKAEHPELREEIGQQCKREIGRSPWTRDGSLALFNCIRAKAIERGLA